MDAISADLDPINVSYDLLKGTGSLRVSTPKDLDTTQHLAVSATLVGPKDMVHAIEELGEFTVTITPKLTP